MFVTVLPISSKLQVFQASKRREFHILLFLVLGTTYYCSPQSNATTVVTALSRAIHLFSGFGLSINGKQVFCGDSIYSGHTVILVLGYLVLSECKLSLENDVKRMMF